MLGEDTVGDEDSVGAHPAVGDHPRIFGKKVGDDALELHGDRGLAVGRDEIDRQPVGLPLDAPRGDHAAQPHRLADGRLAGDDFGGSPEIGCFVAQRTRGEHARARDAAQRDRGQNKSLMLRLHLRSLRSASLRFSAFAMARQLVHNTPPVSNAVRI
jgi:hypothetical protein